MHFLRYLPDHPSVNSLVSYITQLIYSIKEKLLIRVYRIQYDDNLFNTKNPLISVYVPTYNRGNILISRAVPSVLNQTYKNFEFIILDDGSTDNTAELIASLNDSRIRYIKIDRKGYRYPNKSIYHWLAGPVIAANAGLLNVKGSWIARIDDDDEWTVDHLSKLLTFAVNGNFEFVSSHLKMVEKSGVERVITAFDNPQDRTGIGGTQTWLYRSYLGKFRYNINCWRKSYFKVNDTDLQFRIYNANARIGYLEEVTAIIKPRPDEDYIGSKAYLSSPEKYEKFYE
jgi:glycosyltransferase involved in cell wall biosynthesis